MKIPNNKKAILPVEKFTKYLLSNEHQIGRAKARFFIKLGYNIDNYRDLKYDIKRIIEDNEIFDYIRTEYGVKYLVKGQLGILQKADIMTIWIIEHDESVPKFVTAYPAEK